MMVSMAIISCILIILSFAYHHLYALMYLGMLVAGFGLQTGSAISVALATNWFPENQIVTAMSFKSQEMVVRAFVAEFVPSPLVAPPSPNLSYQHNDKHDDTIRIRHSCCQNAIQQLALQNIPEYKLLRHVFK